MAMNWMSEGQADGHFIVFLLCCHVPRSWFRVHGLSDNMSSMLLADVV